VQRHAGESGVARRPAALILLGCSGNDDIRHDHTFWLSTERHATSPIRSPVLRGWTRTAADLVRRLHPGSDRSAGRGGRERSALLRDTWAWNITSV